MVRTYGAMPRCSIPTATSTRCCVQGGRAHVAPPALPRVGALWPPTACWDPPAQTHTVPFVVTPLHPLLASAP